ncbi:hypothetical protein Droror1_Dr00005971 [Drosera rotundifolia]
MGLWMIYENQRFAIFWFCLSVNIIAFVYSGFQAFGLAYSLVTGKHVFTHHLRRQFDFVMDQSPKKVNLVAALVRGMRDEDALIQMPPGLTQQFGYVFLLSFKCGLLNMITSCVECLALNVGFVLNVSLENALWRFTY